MHAFAEALGLPEGQVHELEVPPEDRAHYSKRTIDFEFDYPFGRKELWGLAYRTDFDLSAHEKSSGVELKYLDEEKKEKFVKWYSEVGIKDVPIVGGKNAALGEMYSNLVPLGVNIPDGFALTADAYRYFFEKTGLDKDIQNILGDLDTKSIKNL